MNIAIAGANGQMGRTIIEVATERDDITVALGIDPDQNEERIHGIRIHPPTQLSSLLDERHPNVLIDFTVPVATGETVQIAAEAAIPVVIGTTGFTNDQLETLRQHTDSIPVLKAPNFARGIQAFLAALEETIRTLPTYDIEVEETHHNRKRDAPSGTANTILDRIDAIRGDSQRVHGRVGEQPRDPGEIGVHARRAGDIRGEHEVLIAGNDEIITLTHRAESRRVFAHGALDAAVWLAGKPPGWYTFTDVLEDEQ